MITATRLTNPPYADLTDTVVVAVKSAHDAQPPTRSDLLFFCDTIAVEGDEALWLLYEAPIAGAWGELYDQAVQLILHDAAMDELRYIDQRMLQNAR